MSLVLALSRRFHVVRGSGRSVSGVSKRIHLKSSVAEGQAKRVRVDDEL